jgi:hypothetical protein
MYQFNLHRQLRYTMARQGIDIARESDELFYARALSNISEIHRLFTALYGQHPKGHAFFGQLLQTITTAHAKGGRTCGSGTGKRQVWNRRGLPATALPV